MTRQPTAASPPPRPLPSPFHLSFPDLPSGMDVRLTVSTGSNPEPTERVLQNVRFDAGHVVGWCPLRGAVRCYRLDRVSALRRITGMQPPPSPDSSEGGAT